MQTNCNLLTLQESHESVARRTRAKPARTKATSLAALTRDVVREHRTEEKVWIAIALAGAAALLMSLCL